jgi:type II secretory pathway component PulJ
LRTHDRGFGLIEALLGLVLFTMVLVITADLLNGYRVIMRQSESRGRSLKAARIALAQMRSDLRGAVRVLSPASGATSSTLELERLTPELSPRLPANLPTSPPSSWNMLDATHLYPITYRVGDDSLWREVAGQALFLTRGLKSFAVKAQSERRFEITLTFQERHREPTTLVTRVTRL